MIKLILKFLHQYTFFIPAIFKLQTFFGRIEGLNTQKREVPIIISMSSCESNFAELEMTLFSIFNQKVRPDKVILWLSKDMKLSEMPYNITKFVKTGLEIRFAENINSYTKTTEALKEFKKEIIVTAEDNILYPEEWLKRLYHSYISNPDDIHVHKAKNITVKNKKIGFCRTWEYSDNENSSFQNYPINTGGILFPPNCFIKEFFREDLYKKSSEKRNYLWIWFMAVISDRKIRLVKNHIKLMPCVNVIKQFLLFRQDIENSGKTDKQIYHFMRYYKQNIKNGS